MFTPPRKIRQWGMSPWSKHYPQGMDRDAVVQSESDCAAPAVKGFSNLKSGSNKDVLLDLTPEKPCKPLKGKELGRQKRQQELVQKDARNKEIRPRLTQKDFDHMLSCVKDHDELVADRRKLRELLPKLTEAQQKILILEQA
ncbi:HERC6 [Symbiodinium sp. KB8]|nr:HERC6 [Symbiodinium sp. KB8]